METGMMANGKQIEETGSGFTRALTGRGMRALGRKGRGMGKAYSLGKMETSTRDASREG